MEPFLLIALRSVAVYFFIIIAIRIFGKKELSQLSVTDLVFILLISNSVQNAMVGPDSSLLGGLTAAAALFIFNFILKQISYRDKRFNQLIQGSPVILIHDGKLVQENLNKVKITQDELEIAIREHGVKSVEDVNLAILETDGNISILSDSYQKQSKRKRRVHKTIGGMS
ncbi:MAG: DUF421 domain-containing protein [Bacteroidetes bacterium]|nr:DUF421 domain-containing protein [Bacteroidota bacterium]